jgi:membrane-associated phospholipid phosphatase
VALRDRSPVALPSRRGAALLGALAVVLAALVAIVETGALNRLDQFSVDHLMPWLVAGGDSGISAESFYRPFPWDAPAAIKVLDFWTYPGSVLVSLLVVVGAGYVLYRRAGIVAGLTPAAAWVVGDALEVLGKGVLTRPALHQSVDGAHIHILAFDDSFPSGHMLRSTFVAFCVAVVWPRATRWAAGWAALVGPALVLSSAHTITDVVGGALLALVVLTALWPVVAPARLAGAHA